MQNPGNMSGPQVIVVAQTAPIDTQRRYRNMSSEIAARLNGLGIAHIVIGALCIVLQVVSIVFSEFSTGHGIWIGSLFIVTGVFGIFAGKTGGKCQVVAFHVLSIISAGFAALLFTLAVMFAAMNGYPSYYKYTICAAVMEGLLIFLSLAEGVVAITASTTVCALGVCCCACGGSCCCPTDSQYQQFVDTDQPDFAQQQFMAGSQQQPVFNPNQQQPMLIQKQQQPMFNLSQQQLVFNPTQPMTGFYSQQFAAQQQNDHHPNVLPNTAQPGLSATLPETTGQGADAIEYIGGAAGPLPTDKSTQPSGERSNECLIRFSNSERFPPQEPPPSYDSDSELNLDV